MVKKINNDAITIKSLLEKGYTQYKIAKMLNISKQKVHYWARTEIKSIQTRKKNSEIFTSIRSSIWQKIKRPAR